MDHAVVAHKIEHAFDLGFVGIGLVGNLEAQITGFRVHFVGIRHRIGQGSQMDDLAQFRQVTQEGRRIHAFAQYVASKTQRDVPVVGFHLTAAADLDFRFAQCDILACQQTGLPK